MKYFTNFSFLLFVNERERTFSVENDDKEQIIIFVNIDIDF